MATGSLSQWMANLNLNPDQTLINKPTYDMYKNLPEFANAQVNPVGNGFATINKDVLKAITNYNQIDTSKLGDDLFSKTLKEKAYQVGDNYYINKGTTDYYSKLAEAAYKGNLNPQLVSSLADPVTSGNFNWRYNGAPSWNMTINGQSGVYVPYEVASEITKSGAGGAGVLSDFLGNQNIYDKAKLVDISSFNTDNLAQLAAQRNALGEDYSGKWDNFNLGYFMSQEDYDKYVIPSGGSNGFDTSKFYTNEGNTINTGRGVHDVGNLGGSTIFKPTQELLDSLSSATLGKSSQFLGNDLNNLKWIAQAENDPSLWAYQKADGTWGDMAFDQYIEKKKKGGWLANTINDIVTPVATIASVVPGPWQPFGQGYMAAKGTAQGLQNGNLGQVLGGALSMYGAYNPTTSITNAVGSKLNDGLNLGLQSSGAVNALGSGAINAGLTAASGKGLGSALQSGLASGLGNYTASQLNDLFKNANLDKTISSALTGAGSSAVSSAINNNKNIGLNTLAGLFAGGLSGAGQQAGLTSKTSSSLAKLVTQLAIQQKLRKG